MVRRVDKETDGQLKRLKERVIKHRPVCNKKMEFEPSIAKRRTYCSPDCYHNSLKGRPSPQDKRLKKKCRFCNKEFLTKRSTDNKYCSRNCYYKDKKGKTSWNKGGHMWEDKEHPRGTLGKTSKFKGKSFDEIYGIEQSDKMKSLLRESHYLQLKSGKFKTSNTGIEKIMKLELIKLGFKENEDFFHQYPFRDKRYVCDFAFPKQKIVIECQGDFHHANPAVNWDHNPAASDKELDKSFLYPIQIKQIKQDRAKKAYIEKSGWVFFEAWGAELNNLAERKKVISKIKKLIEERNQI
jgi:very-short-patch-repair endonuclease